MPFVTTIAREPADAVLLLIDRAAPVVAPLIEIRTIVVEAVIAELVSVRVKSAAAAIETDVNVARPDLPLTTTGEAAAPEAEGDVNKIPVPEVDATKSPFVAVIAPRVAVIVVPAVTVVAADTEPRVDTKFPVEATMFPVVAVMPVPAVTVVPALTAPAVATMLPVVAVMPVPAVTVVPADTEPAVAAIFPRVAVIFPAETTASPVVTVSPVPAVNVVPDAKVVVVVNDPGAVIADGNETVAVPAAVTTVIWFVVPFTATTSPDPLAN